MGAGRTQSRDGRPELTTAPEQGPCLQELVRVSLKGVLESCWVKTWEPEGRSHAGALGVSGSTAVLSVCQVTDRMLDVPQAFEPPGPGTSLGSFLC